MSPLSQNFTTCLGCQNGFIYRWLHTNEKLSSSLFLQMSTLSNNSNGAIINDRKMIVFENNILTLLEKAYGTLCTCGQCIKYEGSKRDWRKFMAHYLLVVNA